MAIEISNSKLLEVVVVSVIQIISKLTSHGYAMVVTDTMLKKLAKEHPALGYVTVKLESHANEVHVGPSADGLSDNELGEALNALIEHVDKLTGNYKFKKELWFYLNPYEFRLLALGVELMK